MSMFDQTYYKVTTRSECHHGFQYLGGLNVLTEPFAETGSCVPGGLYFTDLAHVPDFLVLGVYVREVRIPEGSRVVKDGTDKWRTDQLWFGHRWEIQDFLKHHANVWTLKDWYRISAYGMLTEEFIREFADQVVWHIISRYQNLSETFIREFADRVDWFTISQCQDLSDTFIREFADRVNWFKLSFNRSLSESLIREFADRVDWTRISEYHIHSDFQIEDQPFSISEGFIREFADRVDWTIISQSHTLSETFIREFADRIEWSMINHYSRFSESFIREFADRVDWTRSEE